MGALVWPKCQGSCFHHGLGAKTSGVRLPLHHLSALLCSSTDNNIQHTPDAGLVTGPGVNFIGLHICSMRILSHQADHILLMDRDSVWPGARPTRPTHPVAEQLSMEQWKENLKVCRSMFGSQLRGSVSVSVKGASSFK